MSNELFLLHDKFSQICQKFPDRVAIEAKSQEGYKAYTYKEIYEQSRAVGTWLIKEGIKKTETIAIILENCPQWGVCYFGIIYSGSTVVPLDPQLTEDEVYNLLSDCQPKVIFTSKKFIPLFSRFINQLSFVKKIVITDLKESTGNFISLYKIFLEGIPNTEGFWPKNDLDDIASIIYTSGTVGKPKGVMLTHKNFSAEFNSIEKLKLCKPEDNFICILPLYHTYSFMVTLLVPLFYGAKIVYPGSLKSEELLSCMRQKNISILVGVPELFFNLHKTIFGKINGLPFALRYFLRSVINILWLIRRYTGINLSKVFLRNIHSPFGKNLRFFISGGARLNTEVAQDLQKIGFTTLEGYGLTETSPVVTINPPKKPKIGSVGRPMPDVKIKISTPNSQGIGEIAIRGLNVMKGYFRQDIQTKEVIRNGWFYSGDLGYLDKEGYLYITGRIKEVIVLSSGKNIYPEEAENYYLKSKFIKEICVLEVQSQDGIEILQAVIVPNFDYFSKIGEVNIEAKIKWDLENLSQNISTYKRIMGFILVKESLPRTRLGKIKRYEVRNRYFDRLLKKEGIEEKYIPSIGDIEIMQSELGQKIINHIKRNVSLKRDLHLDDHLELDLGIDSLSRVELVLGLEKIFNISIPDSLNAQSSTVRKLILKMGELLIAKREDVSAVRFPSWSHILNMLPPKEIIEAVELNPGSTNKITTFFVSLGFYLILKIFCKLKIEGRDNIPLTGPYIFCTNHSSYLDGFVVETAVPLRVKLNLFFIGAREIFRHPLIKWSIKMARLIPIDPAKELISTMQICNFLLNHNKILCIFPEGQRSIDGRIGDFKKGIGILVKELDMDIVPVAIIGTHQAWARAVKLPRPYPIRIIFGAPLKYKHLIKDLGTAGFSDIYEAIACHLRKEVIKLFEGGPKS